MTGLAAVLVGIGCGDAIAGRVWKRYGFAPWLAGTTVLAAVVLLVAGIRPLGVVIGVVMVAAATAGRELVTERLGPKAGLVLLGSWVAVAAVALPRWEPFDRNPWASFVADRAAHLDAGTVALTLAAAVSATATANVVVRLVLEAARINPATGDSGGTSGILGGRLIGPLERLLIVGFVVAGQPEGVAIVVAAKSILRYPELSANAQGGADPDQTRKRHEAAEYVLLGSLTSWSFALAAAWLATLG